ncbi:hypothetical protein HY641_02440 [Candidatus Woesearchaeota archaeon]|nr:hypothetical protein [Candidatus Woesearchaeota archaeon]
MRDRIIADPLNMGTSVSGLATYPVCTKCSTNLQTGYILSLLVILLLSSACEEPDEAPVDNVSIAMQPAAQESEPAPVPEPAPAEEIPAQPAAPDPEAPPHQVPRSTPVAPETPIAPVPEEKKFVATMPDRLKELIALPEKKVKSYEFVYAPPPDNLARDHYFIKGDKFRVSLYQLNYFKNDDYFDTVFVDTTKKTATGHCEGLRPGRCFNATKAYELKYADWIKVRTPYQWLKEIQYGEIAGSEKIYDRPAVKVYLEKDNSKWWYWLDEYSGLPTRIIQEKNGEETKHEFRYLALNTVTDDFVVHVE